MSDLMAIFTEQVNDWGDRRIKWQNIGIAVLYVVIALLLVGVLCK